MTKAEKELLLLVAATVRRMVFWGGPTDIYNTVGKLDKHINTVRWEAKGNEGRQGSSEDTGASF